MSLQCSVVTKKRTLLRCMDVVDCCGRYRLVGGAATVTSHARGAPLALLEDTAGDGVFAGMCVGAQGGVHGCHSWKLPQSGVCALHRWTGYSSSDGMPIMLCCCAASCASANELVKHAWKNNVDVAAPHHQEG